MVAYQLDYGQQCFICSPSQSREIWDVSNQPMLIGDQRGNSLCVSRTGEGPARVMSQLVLFQMLEM